MQLRTAGELLDVGTPRQQAVLAALAVDAGRPVSIDTLVGRVWGEDPPGQVRNVLYSHMSRIRRLAERSGRMVIARRNAGYVLQVDVDEIDLHRFARLLERGKDADLPDLERSAVLTEALALWEGAPLAGISGEWAEQVRAVWNRRRLDAVVQWGEVQLRLGSPDSVLDPLAELVGEHPLAEALEWLLMRALHAGGRDAEALDRYAAVRQRLADQLGTEPGAELQAVHRAILRGELPTPRRPTPPQAPAPAQLLADTPGFAGRDPELHRLDDLLAAPGTATRVVVLSGTAGVGKTALAIHWAHRVSSRFPDGQLYVNLRGFDPAGSPVGPAEAVRGFLEALTVTPDRIPTTLAAQAGMYRSLLSQRQVLVVLDNARDAEQVRPLLPGAAGCLVLVTSRHQLTGLAAAGAHLVGVDLLDDAEAHTMLRARLGDERIDAEPGAVAEVIGLCARLPLALAVVAARAAAHPTFRFSALAEQLRDARGSLDEFAGSDPVTDARAVFSWSYLGLTAPAARLFRLLGLHAGPDIGVRAVAGLAAVGAATARTLLAELAQSHLLTEHAPGRYAFHDLLRAYAGELAQLEENPQDRAAAVHRLLGHYAHTAYHADGFLRPRREVPPPLTPLPTGAESEPILQHGQALAWFTAERSVLLNAVRQDAAFDSEICDLVQWTCQFLEMQGHWHDELDALSAALPAARRLDAPAKQAFAHQRLGHVHIWFGRYADAARDLQAALDLYRTVGDAVGQAHLHHSFAYLYDRQGAAIDALPHAQQALELFRAAGHEAGQANALNAVGWFHTLLGEHAAAVGYCREALELHSRLGDHVGASQSSNSLGHALRQLGDDDAAIACYESAVELIQRQGYPISEARQRIHLADVHHARGDDAAARAGWQRAHDILAQLAHPDADEVKALLAEVHNRRSTSQE